MKKNRINVKELEEKTSEDTDEISSMERRKFLGFGLTITGLFLGGSVLSLTSTKPSFAGIRGGRALVADYPYSPHYTMVIVQNQCIDCERCLDACRETNNVPKGGYRTDILERAVPVSPGVNERVFMPILCNHCNEAACVRVCPTKATYKDKTTGIVRMNIERCIGCKTCMTACPYNARYFDEDKRAIDKCNFCVDTKLKESGGKITACAAACPANVRMFGDLTDPETEAYKLIHAPGQALWVLRPEKNTMPNVFYTNASFSPTYR